MSEAIATVRLAPGQVGYYDELSRIHLTIGMPQKTIYAGTNVTKLRKSVKSGRLILVNGSFGEDKTPFKLARKGNRYVFVKNDETELAAKTNIPVKEESVSEASPAAEDAKVESEPVVEATVEAKTEEAVEVKDEKADVVEEKKTTRKKSATKKKADKAE